MHWAALFSPWKHHTPDFLPRCSVADAMRLLTKITGSATLMSWGNLAAKSATFVVVIPLALMRLPQSDATLFLLITNILGLLLIMDMGFGATFTRLFAFANSGVPISQLGPNLSPDVASGNASDGTDVRSVLALAQSSARIYAWLAAGAVVVIGAFASSAVLQLAENSTAPLQASIAWITLLATLPCGILLMNYAAIAQGLGQVARWQRLQMWFSLATTAITIAVLLIKPSVLLVIVSTQSITLLNMIVSRRFARALLHNKCGSNQTPTADPRADFRNTWQIVWPASWRSGIGILFSAGIVQGSGVVVTHLSDAAQAGSYLLALQLIRGVNTFAQSPFYSRLPEFATLYAQGQKPQLLALAQRAMQKAYAVFLGGWIGLGLIGKPLFELIGSSLTFPPVSLWTVLGIAFLAERFGAMHIQLYSLSHKIIWHIANGVTGTLMLVLALILQPTLGIIGFAVAVLLANTCFYTWYAALHSYRLYQINVWHYEKYCALPALALAAGYSAVVFFGM